MEREITEEMQKDGERIIRAINRFGKKYNIRYLTTFYFKEYQCYDLTIDFDNDGNYQSIKLKK